MSEQRGDPHCQNRMLKLMQSGGSLLLISLMILDSPAYAKNQTCEDYAEIRKAGHMTIGVSFDIPDPLIREQFRHAMDFWATVLDMEWHSDETSSCAIRVGYGVPEMFDSDDIAQADDPDLTATFRGEIAFNAAFAITPLEAYLVCVHEIGHLLGLDHNPSPTSVMYAVGLEGAEKLEATDVSALSARHRMRQWNDAGQHLSLEFPVGTESDQSFSWRTEQVVTELSELGTKSGAGVVR